MEYEKLITSIEQSDRTPDHHALYSFTLLKMARHDFSNLLAKQYFEPETEVRLTSIL